MIGARALYGVLPIGDVLLYAGSVTRAMSDLQTFLATGSEFDYINSYLSTYEDFIAQPSMAYDGTLPIEKRDDGQYEFAFHDVSFSYPGTNIPVLEHVTLSFAVGEKPPSLAVTEPERQHSSSCSAACMSQLQVTSP